MDREYNSQAFTPEQVENGELKDLIDYLLNFNKKSEKSFMDIHITSDSYCIIVEWSEVHYDFQHECGRFQFVDGDEEVYKEVILPDNSSMFVPRGEAENVLSEWLAEHPTWKKDFWGRWYDESECAHLTVEEDKSDEQ